MVAFLLATFTSPEEIGTTPQSMLWMLPLALSVAVIYKATKLSKIKAYNFIKEALVLFGSIVVFIIFAALALYIFAWVATE